MALTREDIQEAVRTELDARKSVAEEKHHKHHEFIDTMIEREKSKQQLMKKAKETAVGFFVVSFLTSVGGGAIYWFANLIKKVSN